jgi:hypothetical protein
VVACSLRERACGELHLHASLHVCLCEVLSLHASVRLALTVSTSAISASSLLMSFEEKAACRLLLASTRANRRAMV